MFKVTTDKHQLYKKYKDYYRNTKCDSQGNLVNRLSGNGVIINVYALAKYFELGVSDSINIVSELKLESVIQGSVPYYFRGDIWDIIPEIEKRLPELVPDNKRTKFGSIVDAMDVSVYYGVSSTVIRRVLSELKLPKIKLMRCSNAFYLYSDILKIKDTKVFKAAIAKSRIPVSVDAFDKISSYVESKKKPESDEVAFRDMDCRRYFKCLNLACETTDYMDCTQCFHYQSKTKQRVSFVFDPSLVFLPKKDQKKIRALKKIKVFPNSIENFI